LIGLLVWAARAWLRMLRRVRDDAEYTVVAAVGLGLIAFLIHNAVDMDWSFPANPATAFALAGVLGRIGLDPRGTGRGPTVSARQRALMVAALLAALIAALRGGFGDRDFQRGREFAAGREWDAAAASFSSAARWCPLDGYYLVAEGYARARM